jgi:hypothetical protein
MRTKWFVLCAVLGLGLSVCSFALDPILVGDFESGPDTSTPPRYDRWFDAGLQITATTLPAVAATRGTHSLKCVDADGGWGASVQLPLFDMGNSLDNPWIQAILSPGCVISVDATVFAAEAAGGWCELGFIYNTAAPTNGWNLYMFQPMTVDGLPHRYLFTIDDETRNAIVDAIGGWGANIGFGINTGTGSTTIYIDNVWIYPEGPVDEYGPNRPSVEQEFAENPEFVNVILRWKAGSDPNGLFEVNPLIVDEYVFITKKMEDPNLYYLGNTGRDPGLTDPNSQYGPLVLPINSTYRWAVVDVLEGHEQSLIAGVSTLENVDPNNIISPIWSFNTLSTLPIITAQPVSTRFRVGGPNPQFTIAVQSVTTPSYQWYFSQDGIIDPEKDNMVGPSVGGDTDTLTIPVASKSYQGYYYCRVWNAATESGGGEFPDVYSNVVTLVVERKVAEYLFEGNLKDTSGHNIHGTAVGSPSFAAGVGGGSALSLNGIDQYVELGNNGFPRADLLDAGGIGGGLDIGSVVCWIKVNSVPGGEAGSRVAAILSSWNLGDGWPHTAFELAVESDLAASYTNARALVLGETAQVTWVSWRPTWVENFNMIGDGQWHMLAATWAMDDIMRVYVDGSLVALSGDAVSSTFRAWVNGMHIGAAPQNTSGAVHRYFDGLIDNLRVYNYVLPSEDIAQEYYNLTGKSGCIYLDFPGSNFNVDNTGTSYCRVDLADFAVMAQNWLAEGYYP